MPGVMVYLSDDLFVELKKEADKQNANVPRIIQIAAERYIAQLMPQSLRSETEKKRRSKKGDV